MSYENRKDSPASGLVLVLLPGSEKRWSGPIPRTTGTHPYQDLALGSVADPERIVLAKNGREKAVFEKGSDSYQKITGMIRSLMEAELDRNEQRGELGRKLDQTMVYMDLSQGMYLIYEYAADSYAPVYFLMPSHPDDILIAVDSADYRDDAGPHAFMYSQELLDYLNKQ